MMMKRMTNVLMSFLLLLAMFSGSFQTTVLAEEQGEQGTLTVIGTDDNTSLAPTEYEYEEGKTAFEALVEIVDNVEYSESEYGKFFTEINDLEAEDPNYWSFYINGISAQVGADSYVIGEGDHLVFRFMDENNPVDPSVTLEVIGKEGTIREIGWPISFIADYEPTAFDLLKVVMGHNNIEYSSHEWGLMVEGISGLIAEDPFFWSFYVNDQSAIVGAASYNLVSEDAIKFNYESWEDDSSEPSEGSPGTEQPVSSFDLNTLNPAVDSASKYVLANHVGEWEAIALRQAGKAIPASYLENVKSIMKEAEGKFRNITDTERYSLGILAAGGDPTNIEGYNLIEAIYNGDNITRQGLNGIVYGLIALDSVNFDIPETAEWTREKLINHLLEDQNDDGGWAWDGSATSDMDTTAMVLTALAPYKNEENVSGPVDDAVSYLLEKYHDSKIDNSSTAAQVVIALSALSIDANGPLFTKENGTSLIAFLLTFQNTDGGFDWQGGDTSDVFSTEQAFRGIVAYQLFVQGKPSLYSFIDAPPVETQPITSHEKDEEKKGDRLPDTATMDYNLLVIGLLILMLGLLAFYVHDRRKKLMN